MDPGSDVRVKGFLRQPPDLKEWRDPPWHPMVLLLVVPGLGVRAA